MHAIEEKPGLFRALIRFTIRSADVVIVVSRALRDQVASLCDLERDDIPVIDMGVDTEKFLPVEKRQARQALKLETDRRVLMFVGNLWDLKGINYLLEAVSLLKERGSPKFILYVVGHGVAENNLKDQAQRIGLNGWVRFVGSKVPDEVPLWMAAADVVIMPSLAEGFGLVALEAMASGAAVIATNVGGLGEFIQDGENGLLVEPRDSRSIAGKLSLIMENPGVYGRLIRNGLKTADEHSCKNQALKIRRIYRMVLSP